MTTSMASIGRAKQPVRLDHLETLVHHRRRIHRNLAAHPPVRMCARGVGRDVREFVTRCGAKGTARGRQQNASNADRAHIVRFGVRQALEYGVVLAVDRQQRRSAFAHGVDEQRTREHECLLVREQDPLARACRGKGRRQPRCADDRGDDRVRFGQRGDLAKAGLALQHPGRQDRRAAALPSDFAQPRDRATPHTAAESDGSVRAAVPTGGWRTAQQPRSDPDGGQ